jgi:hypothetical protein
MCLAHTDCNAVNCGPDSCACTQMLRCECDEGRGWFGSHCHVYVSNVTISALQGYNHNATAPKQLVPFVPSMQNSSRLVELQTNCLNIAKSMPSFQEDAIKCIRDPFHVYGHFRDAQVERDVCVLLLRI